MNEVINIILYVFAGMIGLISIINSINAIIESRRVERMCDEILEEMIKSSLKELDDEGNNTSAD